MHLSEFKSFFNAALKRNGIDETGDEETEKLFIFVNTLLTENTAYNLTAITDIEEIIYKHLADSLILSRYIPYGAHMIDIGCGAGFPSLPLAIVRKDLTVTAVDSATKKAAFVNHVKGLIQSDNLRVICGRAEEIVFSSKLFDSFDVAAARAVASFPVLCELCMPFLKKDGFFLVMKGRAESETFSLSIESLSKLSSGKPELFPYYLHTGNRDEERTIIKMTKISATNPGVPRKFSQIKKHPLN